jgi:hypothetical protein
MNPLRFILALLLAMPAFGQAVLMSRSLAFRSLHPTNVTSATLVAAWDADDTAGGGASVSSWAGAWGTGTTLSQGTGTRQPTSQSSVINGHKVVRFDGSSDVMSAGLTQAQPLTIFVIAKAANNAGRVLDSTSRVLIELNNGTDAVIYIPAAAITQTKATDDTFANYWVVLTNGGTSSIYVNGSGNTGSLTTTSLGSGSIFVGADNNTVPGSFLNGDIALLVIYSGAISDQERARVEAWANANYPH